MNLVGEEMEFDSDHLDEKRNWIGHVIKEGMLRIVIKGRFQGQKPTGRKKNMMDEVLDRRKYKWSKLANDLPSGLAVKGRAPRV